MRNEMIGAIVRRAIEHPDFRQKLIDDPQAALAGHGFALEAEEWDQLNRIRSEVAAGSATDSEQKLVSIAEEYGIQPDPGK